jgi:toxin secretion/phage lysis holin
MDAPTKAQELKALLATIFGVITVFIGWTGWLFVLWVFTMVLDWRLGVRRAKLHNEYSSDIAREGRWHKLSSFYVALLAGSLDLLVQISARMGLGFELPWHGAVLLPIVLIWYIFSEAGSIIENAAGCGAPIPSWLRKGIKDAQKTVDDSILTIEHSALDDNDNTTEEEK